jgi:hypothetical protein
MPLEKAAALGRTLYLQGFEKQRLFGGQWHVVGSPHGGGRE